MRSRSILRLTPEDISSTPFPTLLRQHLPKQFVDEEEVFGTYNIACTFIKYTKYDKAKLLKVKDVRRSLRTVQNQLLLLRRVPEIAWKKHKKTLGE